MMFLNPKSTSSRRRTWLFALSCVVLLGLAELTLRLVFGLGRPLLMMPHPTIEYLAQPNQEIRRFGHRVSYNAYSMRGAAFSREKSNPREYRILLIGDSVVNGGSTLDEDAVATSEIASSLTREWERPVIAMNVSAGSWGPPNQLAYFKEYGLFDCDVAIVVWSTHDFDDVPTFGPLDPVMSPITNPPSALSEALFRYAIPLLRRELGTDASAKRAPAAPTKKRRAEGSMRDLLEVLRKRVPVLVLLHLTRPELRAFPTEEVSFLSELAAASGAHFENLGPDFARALANGNKPYRFDDPIHTTPAGQHLIAMRVIEWVRRERTRPDVRDE